MSVWNGMDPNSEHQNWSYWRFEIYEAGRHVPLEEVRLNAARWLKMGFGSVGRARVTRTLHGYRIEAQVEGETAADPNYVRAVRDGFKKFVVKGWGLGAMGHLAESRVLAGEAESGPRAQLVVMPTIINEPAL